jgi:hypothetical protein
LIACFPGRRLSSEEEEEGEGGFPERQKGGGGGGRLFPRGRGEGLMYVLVIFMTLTDKSVKSRRSHEKHLQRVKRHMVVSEMLNFIPMEMPS